MSIDAALLQSHIAQRIRSERTDRGWSLADLATKSGDSKPMLSKIEREETSPTAIILARIASAFGRTLAELVSPGEKDAAGRLVRVAEQAQWRDPATGYVRRQIFLKSDVP